MQQPLNTPTIKTSLLRRPWFMAISLLAVIITIGVFSFLFYRNSQSTELSQERSNLATSNIDESITNTGVKESSLDFSIENLVTKMSLKLPLQFPNATMRYSVKKRVFEVDVCPPHADGLSQVNTWLENNGFAGIPQEKFIFTQVESCPEF